MNQQPLHTQAQRLAKLLKAHNRKIVLAESCTGGLVSAALTRIAGISAWHCGSAVVYQPATKTAWLEIPAEVVAPHDAVTSTVAERMALAVLAKTPQADLAASVTGHLGPDAPADLDGLVFAAVVIRDPTTGQPGTAIVRHTRLAVPPLRAGAKRVSRQRLRVARQTEAAEFVLALVAECLEAG